MNPAQNPTMSILHSRERQSRVDSIPRIGVSITGRRFSARALSTSREMKVPTYRFSFISQTKENKPVSWDFSFYITGKALVVTSIEWKPPEGSQKESASPKSDEGICELILETLKDFAVRHKASSIYASKQDISPLVLLELGFTSIDSHDYMQLTILGSKQRQ